MGQCPVGTILFWFRIDVYTTTGDFSVQWPRTTGLSHLVVNYDVNEDGDEIRVHWDGTLVASDQTKGSDSRFSVGDGKIVVGRLQTDNSLGFASVLIDELIFYNKVLSNDDIEGLFAQRK